MSLQAFQTAMASLIRRPLGNRGALDVLFAGYDLTPAERQQLDQLAGHAELNKYADEQADQRWDFIERNLHKLWTFVDPGLFQDIWFNDYEPQAMRISADLAGHTAMSRGFLHFLCTDPATRELLASEAPAYIWDLLAFVSADKDVTVLASPEPDGKYARLRLLRLEYDILDLLTRDQAEAGEQPDLQPLAQPLLLAVLCREPLAGARYFTLEPPLFEYLSREVAGGDGGLIDAEIGAGLQTLGLT